MRPRINRKYFSLKTLQVCVVLLFGASPIFATGTHNFIVRQNVSNSNREELAGRMRTITGWTNLTFDADGALKIGNAAVRGGSTSARDLLLKTISGNRVILIEDASSRKDVVFCRVVLGRLDRDPSSEVYVVLIDFDDFQQVSGDKQARAAFDVGWAVLHEVDHVVQDSEDPKEDIPGDCEGHINRMRRELGLPVRNSYFFSFLPIRNDNNLISRFVRLGFEEDRGSSKPKRYWLIWDAAVVGGLADPSELAGQFNQQK
ncbi:MAG TPA: hypothetical protein VFR78_07955 [Pyrinomonadaceae bacterium]|nr:hypothetical protein [Pyrinomonadaceae bacterium]